MISRGSPVAVAERRVMQYTTFSCMRSLAMAASSFMASSSASCTKFLMAFSPQAPSVRLRNLPESLHSGKSDAVQFDGITVEHVHACTGEHPHEVILTVGFEIVIAQHGHDRHVGHCQIVQQNLSLFRKAVIGQVSTRG